MTFSSALGGASGDFSVGWTGAVPVDLSEDFDDLEDTKTTWTDRYRGALQRSLGESVVLVGGDEFRESLNVPMTAAELASYKDRAAVAMAAIRVDVLRNLQAT